MARSRIHRKLYLPLFNMEGRTEKNEAQSKFNRIGKDFLAFFGKMK